MTAKEKFEVIKEKVSKLSNKEVVNELFNMVANGCTNMNDLVCYFDKIEQALNELDELKRDVKRYFEMRGRYLTDIIDVNYYVELEERLGKVGREE